MPIGKRSQTGRALLLKCIQAGKKESRFEILYTPVGLDPILGPEIVRFKEGAWCVLNPLLDEKGAEVVGKRLAHGRLAVIEAIDTKQLVVKFPFPGRGDSESRFKHWSVPLEVGQYYTLDEMADDLNGDKLVAACRNAADNLLVRLAERPETVGVVHREEASPVANHFVERINQLEHPFGLTSAQQQIVAGHLDQPILLVQGPPGTVKSHTLGWATLSRLLTLPAQSPRVVAVSSKTHNAINIVLGSIAGKWRRLQERAP